jgi:proteic killer suppression protein
LIETFKNRQTEQFWREGSGHRLPQNLRRVAMRKLKMLHDAQVLEDLRTPPGNRLEELKGNRAGQHSVRINDQYRLCFRWAEGNAYEVEIVDYHR